MIQLITELKNVVLEKRFVVVNVQLQSDKCKNQPGTYEGKFTDFMTSDKTKRKLYEKKELIGGNAGCQVELIQAKNERK